VWLQQYKSYQHQLHRLSIDQLVQRFCTDQLMQHLYIDQRGDQAQVLVMIDYEFHIALKHSE